MGTSQTFHVSHEVTVLGISLFVIGLGSGPLLVGPLSEMYGAPANSLMLGSLWAESVLSRSKYHISGFVYFFPHLYVPSSVRSKHWSVKVGL